MPAELPAHTAYTYAVELSADEALAVGASSVLLSAPVPMYVENFIEAPVGTAVPTGYYDRSAAAWVPSENGRVVKVRGIAAGIASLDVDGSGQAANASMLASLGISEPELRNVAQLYGVGQTLWRVPIAQFTPWDCNWPYGPPGGAVAPDPDISHVFNGRRDGTSNDCQKQVQGYSTISCASRSLGEDVKIAGMPFKLHYESSRVSRSSSQNALTQINIKVPAAQIPQNVQYATLEIEIGSRRWPTEPRPASAFVDYTFTYDGRDGFGRHVVGTQVAKVNLCFTYPAEYYSVDADFAQAFDRVLGSAESAGVSIRGSREAGIVELCRETKHPLGAVLPTTGIGGWDLDIHHTYDGVLERVEKGDGSRRTLVKPGNTAPVSTFAGRGIECHNVAPSIDEVGDTIWDPRPCRLTFEYSGNHDLVVSGPMAIDIAPDGTLYLWDQRITGFGSSVIELAPNGQSRRVVGRPNYPESSFLPAPPTVGLQTALYPGDLKLGPDNWLYITGTEYDPDDDALPGCNRVHRYSRDGTAKVLVAGNGQCSASSPDGQLATDTAMLSPVGLAFGPDNTLYIAEPNRVHRIGTDGRLTTVAGTPRALQGADPDLLTFDPQGPVLHPVRATDVEFGRQIRHIAVDSQGQVYVSTDDGVYVVRTDGIIQLAAGGFVWGEETATATPFSPYNADLSGINAIAVDRQNNLIIAQTRKVSMVKDGVLIEIASRVNGQPFREGMSAAGAISTPVSLAIHPDGRILVGDVGRSRIIALNPGFTTVTRNSVASADGSELWQFDSDGKHLRTLDAISQSIKYEFTYNASGFLSGVRDGDGQLTAISRDSQQRPIAIVPPLGEATVLSIGQGLGLGGVHHPDGTSHEFTYEPNSLRLSTMKDQTGEVYRSVMTPMVSSRVTRLPMVASSR
jgi:YD repeat-containing protein